MRWLLRKIGVGIQAVFCFIAQWTNIDDLHGVSKEIKGENGRTYWWCTRCKFFYPNDL